MSCSLCWSCGLVHTSSVDLKRLPAGPDFKLQNEILTLQPQPVSMQPPQSGCDVFNSAVTTRVHQPLSYAVSLTMCDVLGGPGLFYITQNDLYSPGSSTVWVLKRKHTKSDFLPFLTVCTTPLWRALCG